MNGEINLFFPQKDLENNQNEEKSLNYVFVRGENRNNSAAGWEFTKLLKANS